MNKTIDWTKPVRSVGNQYDEVRVLCTDRKVNSTFKIILLLRKGNTETACYCTPNGYTNSYGMMENAPTTIKVAFKLAGTRSNPNRVVSMTDNEYGVEHYNRWVEENKINSTFIKEIEVEV